MGAPNIREKLRTFTNMSEQIATSPLIEKLDKKIKEQDFLEKNIRDGSILSISQWREVKHIVQEQPDE